MICRAFTAEQRKVVAKGLIGFVEGLAGDGIVVGEFLAHADSLRALSGEQECDCCHDLVRLPENWIEV